MLNFPLINNINFHNNYIIANYDVSLLQSTHLSNDNKYTSFSTTSPFQISYLYKQDKATTSNAEKKGKQGRRRKKDEWEASDTAKEGRIT